MFSLGRVVLYTVFIVVVPPRNPGQKSDKKSDKKIVLELR